jgi:hypothetical protein
VNLSCCCRKNISSLDVCCLLLSYVNENILRVLTQWELQESSSCCRPQYCSVIIATPFCHISCGFPVCSYLSPLSLSMLVSHFVDNTLGLSPCSAGACRERERTTRWPASEVQTIFVLYSRWMSHTHTHIAICKYRVYMNNHSQITDKGWASSLRIKRCANNHSPEKSSVLGKMLHRS